MHYLFDIISDTHIESWPDLDLAMIATSPYCIIAGGVGSEREEVINFLYDIEQSYEGVFYIDGDNEHQLYYNQGLDKSYEEHMSYFTNEDDLVYLHNHVVIANNVALVGCNGWWDFNFNPEISREQAIAWWCEEHNYNVQAAEDILIAAATDAVYMHNTLERLHDMDDIDRIIVITHTVPLFSLIEHDPRIVDSVCCNTMGNRGFETVLNEVPTDKVDTWVFGHYTGDIDTTVNGIRFISNARGAPDDVYAKSVYHPKRIAINLPDQAQV